MSPTAAPKTEGRLFGGRCGGRLLATDSVRTVTREAFQAGPVVFQAESQASATVRRFIVAPAQQALEREVPMVMREQVITRAETMVTSGFGYAAERTVTAASSVKVFNLAKAAGRAALGLGPALAVGEQFSADRGKGYTPGQEALRLGLAFVAEGVLPLLAGLAAVGLVDSR